MRSGYARKDDLADRTAGRRGWLRTFSRISRVFAGNGGFKNCKSVMKWAFEFLENVGNAEFKNLKSVMKWAFEFLKNVGNSGLKNLKSVIYYPYFQAKWRFS